LSKIVEIRKSIQSDILAIAVNMRDEDVKEVMDSHMHSPYRALYIGFMSKGGCWTIIVDDTPVAMVGVAKNTSLCKKGRPWLLGTNAMIDDKKIFMRVSREVLKQLRQGVDFLENYVSIENKCSMRWLKALGFTIGESVNSITGVTFKRFYWESS